MAEKKRLYKYSSYVTDIKGVSEKLQKYGVAIIPNVIDKEETLALREGVAKYLKRLTSALPTTGKSLDIDLSHSTKVKGDSSTFWKMQRLFLTHHTMFQRWQAGHIQEVWDVRQNPKVAKVFAKGLWKVSKEDLQVSFDGLSFLIPPETTGKGFENGQNTRGSEGWLHTDQGWGKRPKTEPREEEAYDGESVQSWITAYPVEEGDGTLVVLEKSHLYHEEFGKKFDQTHSKNWCQLAKVPPRKGKSPMDFYLERGCKKVYIKCPAGSMVLWDSRTIHAGSLPIKGREHKNPRLVTYVCYTPRDWCTEGVMKKRRKALEDLRTTSHLPHSPTLFPVKPRLFAHQSELKGDLEALADASVVKPPKLSSLGKRLAGVK
jgi:hypothetical protein